MTGRGSRDVGRGLLIEGVSGLERTTVQQAD